AIARELEDRRAIGRYLGDIGYIKGLQGEYEEAIRLNELAAESAREAGDRWLEADALSSLAQMYRMQGELESSRRYYLDSLDIMSAAEDLPRTAYVFQGLAAIASAEGDHESAARLWAVADSIADRAGGSASAEVAMIGDVIGEAREAIGDEAVEQAMGEGAAMHLEEAVAAVRRA
ncbi:MAG: tetratricopeptide repeat protein, partial [Actinomycetota bacterium]|nr:tetratricopeptide repeat protein [Actinomycetota bacterium]